MNTKSILSTLLGGITYPFRAGVKFVDTRPSAAQIKTHLSELEPVVIEKAAGGCEVQLRLVDSNVTMATLLEVETPDDAGNKFYADGVAKGFSLSQKMVMELTRGRIAEQTRTARQAKNSEKAQKMRDSFAAGEPSKAAAAPTTTPLAKTVPLEVLQPI